MDYSKMGCEGLCLLDLLSVVPSSGLLLTFKTDFKKGPHFQIN